MISGQVDLNKQAIIRVTVKDTAGVDHEFDAAVDTGYDGFLTLPPHVIAQLGLPFVYQTRGVLADGTIVRIDHVEADIVWDGQIQTIRVGKADSIPLVGMSMLDGYRLWIEVVPNGVVQIERIP